MSPFNTPHTPQKHTRKQEFLRTELFSVVLSQEASDRAVWPQSRWGASGMLLTPPTFKGKSGAMPLTHRLTCMSSLSSRHSVSFTIARKSRELRLLSLDVLLFTMSIMATIAGWIFILWCFATKKKSNPLMNMISLVSTMIFWDEGRPKTFNTVSMDWRDKARCWELGGYKRTSQARVKTQCCDSHLVLLWP